MSEGSGEVTSVTSRGSASAGEPGRRLGSLKGSAEWTCWRAVGGVSGDEKAVGMKVDGEELKVVGIEGKWLRPGNCWKGQTRELRLLNKLQ